MTGPYRLLAHLDDHGAGWGTARWTPAGGELGPASHRPDRVPPSLVVEAMAQCAGMVLGREEGDRWLLAGVDACDVEPADWDVAVEVRAEVLRRSGTACRVRVTARSGDRGIGGATVLMARLRLP